MPIHQLNPYSCVLPETRSERSSLASLREKLDYEGIVVVDEACIDLSEPGCSSVTSIRRRRCAKALGSQESGPHKYQGAICYNDFTPGAHLALRTLSPGSSSSALCVKRLKCSGHPEITLRLAQSSPLGMPRTRTSGTRAGKLSPDNARAACVQDSRKKHSGARSGQVRLGPVLLVWARTIPHHCM
ncbi:hypothetical protein BGW80DRAFT_702181 [Lactifluus volemus]|nr:hypothetical protein BGW80DRAFT_702181 [Lactifluus volemus]